MGHPSILSPPGPSLEKILESFAASESDISLAICASLTILSKKEPHIRAHIHLQRS